MGTWGTGAFDNDAACDWSADLTEADDLSLVENTLSSAEEADEDELDLDLACEAIAACEVVARMQGRGGRPSAHTAELDQWIKARAERPSQRLIKRDDRARSCRLELGPGSAPRLCTGPEKARRGLMAHRSQAELDAGLPEILAAPRRLGTLERIVRRPSPGEREVLDEAQLDVAVGLVGDRWCIGTPEKPPHPAKQITIMSSRVAALLAGGGDWAPAGDQLFVDLDLTEEHLPAGKRLSIGGALLEVTADPHTGCKKFAERFGVDAVVWTKAPERAHLRLRGLHARVIVPGTIPRGDKITVVDS